MFGNYLAQTYSHRLTLKGGPSKDFHILMYVCMHTKPLELFVGIRAVLQAYSLSRGQTGSVYALNIVMLLTISSVINRKMHK